MDNASLKDFRGGEGTYVVDALERSLLLPVDMAELGNLRRQEVFLSIKEILTHGKTSNTCDSVDFCSLVSNLPCACFNWQTIQATYRLEEATNEQSRTLELERDKCLDAT